MAAAMASAGRAIATKPADFEEKVAKRIWQTPHPKVRNYVEMRPDAFSIQHRGFASPVAGLEQQSLLVLSFRQAHHIPSVPAMDEAGGSIHLP